MYTPCTTTNTPRTHKIGVSDPHAYIASPTGAPVSTSEFAIVQNNHRWIPGFGNDPGNNGTPHDRAEGIVVDKNAGSGSLVMIPRADDMRTILPLLIGGTWNVNELEPDFICNYFTLEAFKGISNHHHINAKTSTATFTSSSTQPTLQLEWGIESARHTRDTTFTAGLSQSILQPFNHVSTTFNLDGTEYKIDNINLQINNNLTLDLYENCPERVDIPMNAQEIILSHTMLYNDVAKVALQDLGTATAAATLLYEAAGGDLSLLITLPALHSVVSPPDTPSGNTPVNYEFAWKAYTTGTGGSLVKPIKFTLDDTP